MNDQQHARRVGTLEAADYCQLSPRTLERWRWAGEGPPYLKLGRRVVYDLGDLDLWLAERRRYSTSSSCSGEATPRRRARAGSAAARPDDRRME